MGANREKQRLRCVAKGDLTLGFSLLDIERERESKGMSRVRVSSVWEKERRWRKTERK